MLTNDKVKVLIEKNDIKNFELIDFDIDCDDTKNAVAVLLIGIYEQTGLNFLNSKILIESFKGCCQSYYVIITRISDDNCPQNIQSDNNEDYMYLFKLNFIEDVIDIASKIKNQNIDLKQSKLYKYKNRLYISLYFDTNQNNESLIDEIVNKFGYDYTRCKWSILNDVILQEWGNLLNDNVIEKIMAAV